MHFWTYEHTILLELFGTTYTTPTMMMTAPQYSLYTTAVVVDGGKRVYVVGGGRGSSNPDNSVISFHKSRSRWQTTNYNAITKRSYTTFVRNVPTELNCVSKFE